MFDKLFMQLQSKIVFPFEYNYTPTQCSTCKYKLCLLVLNEIINKNKVFYEQDYCNILRVRKLVPTGNIIPGNNV